MPRVNQFKCPERFGEGIARAVKNRLILGLDLGTNCGYSFHYFKPGEVPTVRPEHMGQWDLSAGSYDSGAIRFVRLRQFLSYTQPDLVCYEDVKAVFGKHGTGPNVQISFARGANAGELLGAFKATLCAWCEEHDIPCTGFPIGAIKKRATMRGNVGKDEVIRACNESFGTAFEVEGHETTGVDNIADAAWVCLMAQEQYGLGLSYPKECDGDVE